MLTETTHRDGHEAAESSGAVVLSQMLLGIICLRYILPCRNQAQEIHLLVTLKQKESENDTQEIPADSLIVSGGNIFSMGFCTGSMENPNAGFCAFPPIFFFLMNVSRITVSNYLFALKAY